MERRARGTCGINTAYCVGRFVTWWSGIHRIPWNRVRLGHGSGHLAVTTDKGTGEEALQVGEELWQHSVQPGNVELAESEQFDGIALLQVLLDVVRIAGYRDQSLALTLPSLFLSGAKVQHFFWPMAQTGADWRRLAQTFGEIWKVKFWACNKLTYEPLTS